MEPDITVVNLIGGIKPALTRRVNAPTAEKGRENENWQQRRSSVSEIHSIIDSILAAMEYRPTDPTRNKLCCPKARFSLPRFTHKFHRARRLF
jgi:hypothetical protein